MKKETIGLFVTMKAKLGKEKAVKDLLVGGLDFVNKEPLTESWFAFQMNENTFGIYDTFQLEEGRQEHLKGEVAKALLSNAQNLLDNFDAQVNIQPLNVTANNHKLGEQNMGLLVIMKAKNGKSESVKNFLQAGKELVNDEPNTLSWYAMQFDDNTFGIFDTFADNEGRNLHLSGKVATALMENAPLILDGFESNAIQKIDILASK